MDNLCFNCGRVTSNSYPLCINCNPPLLKKSTVCNICGIPTSNIVRICTKCTDSNWYFNYNYSLFHYSGLSKDILEQFKFSKDLTFARYYSKYIVKQIKTMYKNPIVCPIPTSLLKRKIKNGYTLDSIVKLLKKEKIIISNVLKKRFSKTQKFLSKIDRESNLKNKFFLKKHQLIPTSDLILLDDIFTTGATINTCAKILSEYGYNNIYSLTLYRD